MKIVYCVIYSCYDSLFVCEFQGLPSHRFPVIFFFVNWYILTDTFNFLFVLQENILSLLSLLNV